MATTDTPVITRTRLVVDMGFGRGTAAMPQPRAHNTPHNLSCAVKYALNNNDDEGVLEAVERLVAAQPKMPLDRAALKAQIRAALDRGEMNVLLPLAQILACGK